MAIDFPMTSTLSELGQPEEALRAIKESVELYQLLSQQHPVVFNLRLALVPDHFAVIHSTLTHAEEAPQTSSISSL